VQPESDVSDLIVTCSRRAEKLANMLLSGVPLPQVLKENLLFFKFVEQAKMDMVAEALSRERSLVLFLSGETASLERGVDNEQFEGSLPIQASHVTWLRSLAHMQTTVIAGDAQAAMHARRRAEEMLLNISSDGELSTFHYLGALAIAGVLSDEVQYVDGGLYVDMLKVHAGQLEILHKRSSSTNHGAHELVSGELARVEGRQLDAMLWYERAIRSARESGDLVRQGLAFELVGRFYMSSSLDINGIAHFHEAIRCYGGWGAKGKVRQIRILYPQLATQEKMTASTSTLLRQLDVTTVVKASQALSGQMETPELIERLMAITLQNAGADRGLLVVPRPTGYEVVAEARVTEVGSVETQSPTQDEVGPQALIRYVMRTRKRVIIDDATRSSKFSADPYFKAHKVRSVLCVAISRQNALSAVLYLENGAASHVFTSERALVLELLAAQAAISLEISRLYGDLRDREARIRRLVDANIIGIYHWDDSSVVSEANDAFLKLTGYSREELKAGKLLLSILTPPEMEAKRQEILAQLRKTGSVQPFERVYIHKNGTHVPVLVGAAGFVDAREQGVAFVVDLTERKEAERHVRESERRYRDVQSELAHANRVATMGHLSASIAHEVRQPISAMLINVAAARLCLAATPPKLADAIEAIDRIKDDASRASEVVNRLRVFFQKQEPKVEVVDINRAISEVIALLRSEIVRSAIDLKIALSDGLPDIEGDRVQLQQIILNVLVNAIEALAQTNKPGKAISVITYLENDNHLVIEVADNGAGVKSGETERIFEAFHTTKPNGMGMGLAICRSIAEAHNGTLRARENGDHGLQLILKLPVSSGDRLNYGTAQ
jgi:PAS domain S-box-containing protein